MTKVIRTNRKSIAIIVENDGSLTIRAPKRVSDSVIQKFIAQNTEWIQKTQVKMRNKMPSAHRFEDGEQFFYLGARYPLRLVDVQKPALIFNNGFILDRKFRSEARQIFQKWYQREARKVITERVQKAASLLKYDYSRIRITSARTRWGSCSSRKTLSFSYRLIMAPINVIDSVIIHELVHLEFPNHSTDFYRRLEQHMPDYREYRNWLRENGHQFNLE